MTSRHEADPTALPAGSIVLHIGAHKTGTTGLQAALAAARPRLQGLGILYPGDAESHHVAALSAMGRGWGWKRSGVTPYPPGHWRRLASQARGHRGTVVISSEFLCEATPEQARRIVDDLGPERVRVVVSLRNLGLLLASSWQQSLKFGLVTPYGRWLRRTLTTPDARESSSFWRRQDHAAVIERWGATVGLDRVTALVADESDRDLLYRRFDRLLGLPDGTLEPQGRTNRSMTLPEAEFVLAFNQQARDRFDWADYNRVIRGGAIRRMVESRVPAPDEPAIRTPAWATDIAAEIAGEMAGRLRELQDRGLVVVGDLDSLCERVAVERGGRREAHDVVPIGAAVAALLGAVQAPPESSSWSRAAARLRSRLPGARG